MCVSCCLSCTIFPDFHFTKSDLMVTGCIVISSGITSSYIFALLKFKKVIMWLANYAQKTPLWPVLSRDSDTKQISSRDCVLGLARTPQPPFACFDWGSGAVLLKATYLRCSDIRQPFPGKSGFHIK